MALVVGNSGYSKVPLRNPGNDARAIAAALERLGFEVTLALDTTRRQLDEASQAFAASLRSGDLALFYYSGHGAQLNQENYLIPVDFEGTSVADLRYNGFPAQQIRDRLEESGARVRVMILDACRDNPYRGARSAAGGLAPMGSPAEGTLIAYATAENSTAADNASEANGLYTKFLLNALSTPGLSLKQVFEQTKNDVWTKGERRQLPYVYDGIVGDVILTGSPPAVAEPGPAPAIDPAKEAWDLAKNSHNRAMLEAIAREFPDSTYARLARVELAGIEPAAAPNVPAATPSLPGNNSSPPPARKKMYKDKQEYTLYDSAAKESDANKKLVVLNTWKEKYPDSDFRQERLALFLSAYQQLGQSTKMVDTAKEILAIDPKDIQSLYWIAFLTPTLGNTGADALDTAQAAASGLLMAEKPASVKDEDWNKAKVQTGAVAYTTLGWVAMNRKDNDTAEQDFKKSLALSPNASQVSYWLGSVILAEHRPENQSEALYDFARAAAYDGPGALSLAGRKQIDDYLTRVYAVYHGDGSGLAELKAMAQASATPPAGFQIKMAPGSPR